MRPRQMRSAVGVIAMAMRDQHVRQLRVSGAESAIELGQMLRLTRACIDERRRSVLGGEQVGVVAAAGHRSRIVSAEKDRREHVRSV